MKATGTMHDKVGKSESKYSVLLKEKDKREYMHDFFFVLFVFLMFSVIKSIKKKTIPHLPASVLCNAESIESSEK